MHDIIVIGGGPAGMTAALYALRNNKSVLILEKEAFGGQIATSPRLENYPTIESISGSEWADRLFEQVTNLGAEFELEEVESIEKIDNVFHIKTNYAEHEALAVIVANGVKPRKMGLPNEDDLVGKGVSYCAVCDGPFYKGKEIYLIGDANTALQYALLLSGYCPKIHMLTLFDKLFGDQILIDRVMATENIDIRHNLLLKKLEEENGELVAIELEDTISKEKVRFETNNCFIAIGQVPQNEFLKDLIELNKGFIETDESMRTSVPGLFAAGDTRVKENKQVITACNDGAIAAMSAVKYINTL
ncbi:MAG: FAD-dependent oxidoreductase [Bacilli bacterium]|nr:FAD-dependent oxidoreductase [Bacilli bacterium]